MAAAGLITVGGLGYGVREHSRANELSERQQATMTAMGRLESRMQDLTLKMNQQAAEKERPAPQRARRVAAARPVAARKPAEDPRWKHVESRLDANEQKIATAREEVEKTRQELEGQLGSAKDELGGSIARTHGELVLLQKRGERDYSEFTLSKSKEFRKVGPMSLSLRKADTKHRRYDLQLVFDDARLEKKNVNLFEPVYLTVNDRPQPVELVVNQITKNEVRGYVSQPKYRKSELVSEGAPRTKLPEPPR